MEKDFGSWFYHQHTDWQAPNLNSLSASLDMVQQNSSSVSKNTWNNMVSKNESLPVSTFPRVTHYSEASQENEPRNWFYRLPHFRQAFVQREKLPACLNKNCGWAVASNLGSGCSQKRFLIFDKSADQKTLAFSSEIGATVNNLPSWSPKLPAAFDLKQREPQTKRHTTPPSVPFLNGAYNEENRKDDVRSEMHEDTEELDALLYSDDDYDHSEDDEVTSTGHSPSTMTADGYQQERVGESGEEVASSGGSTKRQKLKNGRYDVPSLMDTASSAKTNRCSEYDDAEYSCDDGNNQVLGKVGSLSGNKRSRKEKIHQIVSILQGIIPGGKSKDAIVFLDEAIHYLRSLKVEAKDLGLDTV